MGPNFRSLTLAALLLSVVPPFALSADKNALLLATEEMQRANYFTFVLLLNMSPPDKIPPNVTFFMPTDRMLSKTAIPENAVSDFLLRHSIPSTLLFDHLEHFPTNSLIPSSYSNYMIRIVNNGRKSFFLNNVRLVSPNLCVDGSSVRCHGIDGILADTNPVFCPSRPGSAPPVSPPQPASSPVEAPLPTSQPSLIPPPQFPDTPILPPVNWNETIAPEPGASGTRPSNSGSLRVTFRAINECLKSLVVILVLFFCVW